MARGQLLSIKHIQYILKLLKKIPGKNLHMVTFF